jgi:hypothetical protein
MRGRNLTDGGCENSLFIAKPVIYNQLAYLAFQDGEEVAVCWSGL